MTLTQRADAYIEQHGEEIAQIYDTCSLIRRAWLAGYRAARRDAQRRPRTNACTDPCDNPNGPCACGAWHKETP